MSALGDLVAALTQAGDSVATECKPGDHVLNPPKGLNSLVERILATVQTPQSPNLPKWAVGVLALFVLLTQQEDPLEKACIVESLKNIFQPPETAVLAAFVVQSDDERDLLRAIEILQKLEDFSTNQERILLCYQKMKPGNIQDFVQKMAEKVAKVTLATLPMQPEPSVNYETIFNRIKESCPASAAKLAALFIENPESDTSNPNQSPIQVQEKWEALFLDHALDWMAKSPTHYKILQTLVNILSKLTSQAQDTLTIALQEVSNKQQKRPLLFMPQTSLPPLPPDVAILVAQIQNRETSQSALFPLAQLLIFQFPEFVKNGNRSRGCENPYS